MGWTATTRPALALVHRARSGQSAQTMSDGGRGPPATTRTTGTLCPAGQVTIDRQVDRESIRGEPAVVLRAGEIFAITTWPATLHHAGTALSGASRSAAVTAWGCPDDMSRVAIRRVASGSSSEVHRRVCRMIEHSMMRQASPGLGTVSRVRGPGRACRGHDRLD